MVFRPTSLLFIAHFVITIYVETYTWWFSIVAKTSSTSAPLRKFPVDVVWRQMVDLQTAISRENYMLE